MRHTRTALPGFIDLFVIRLLAQGVVVRGRRWSREERREYALARFGGGYRL